MVEHWDLGILRLYNIKTYQAAGMSKRQVHNFTISFNFFEFLDHFGITMRNQKSTKMPGIDSFKLLVK